MKMKMKMITSLLSVMMIIMLRVKKLNKYSIITIYYYKLTLNSNKQVISAVENVSVKKKNNLFKCFITDVDYFINEKEIIIYNNNNNDNNDIIKNKNDNKSVKMKKNT